MNSKVVLSSLFSSVLLVGASQAVAFVTLHTDPIDGFGPVSVEAWGADNGIGQSDYTPVFGPATTVTAATADASGSLTAELSSSHFQFDIELSRSGTPESYARAFTNAVLVTFRTGENPVDYVLDGVLQSAEKNGYMGFEVYLWNLDDQADFAYYTYLEIFGDDTDTERYLDVNTPFVGGTTGTLHPETLYGLNISYTIEANGGETYTPQAATGFLSLAFVPEPSSALGSLAAAGLFLARRRRN